MKAKFPNIAISFEAQIAIPYLMPTMVLREAEVCTDPSVDTHLPQEHSGRMFPASAGDNPCTCAIPSLGRYLSAYLLASYLTISDGEKQNIL